MYIGHFFILIVLGAYLLLIFFFTLSRLCSKSIYLKYCLFPRNVVVQQISLLQLTRHQTGAKVLGIPDYLVVPILT